MIETVGHIAFAAGVLLAIAITAAFVVLLAYALISSLGINRRRNHGLDAGLLDDDPLLALIDDARDAWPWPRRDGGHR